MRIKYPANLLVLVMNSSKVNHIIKMTFKKGHNGRSDFKMAIFYSATLLPILHMLNGAKSTKYDFSLKNNNLLFN